MPRIYGARAIFQLYKKTSSSYASAMSNNPAARVEEYGFLAQVRGREWRLLRPADLESLWQKIASADERIPYWTELWPASLALADWLVERRAELAGRLCLDLGCGLGLTALLAKSLAARVTALDYETDALNYLRKNADINQAACPLLLAMDITRPAFANIAFWRVWAADMVYERAMFQPLLNFFEQFLDPSGIVWLAEPGRSLFASFMEEAGKRGWHCNCCHETKIRAFYEDEADKHVKIWALNRRT